MDDSLDNNSLDVQEKITLSPTSLFKIQDFLHLN